MQLTERKYYLIVILLFLAFISKGQDDYFKKENNFKFDRSRIYFGGNLGSIQFGSITSIDIAPIVGYRFTDKLSAGVGISYQYYSNIPSNFSTSIYGGRVLVNYLVNKYLITQAEGDLLSFETKYFDTGNQYPNQARFLYPAFYVGGGYMQRIGEHSYSYIMILWNILNSADSPYGNPDFRIGFAF